jgi:gluconokinase
MSPLCKIKWFSQHEHTVFNNTATFISIKEYIWHKLFGVYEIDHSVASATGLFHVVGGHWFLPALQFCGIRREQLSTPVPTHHVRTGLQPTTASLLHLPPGIPFCIGASDGCLANVGSNALSAGTAALTIGTSGAVRVASSRPVAIFPDMLFNYRLDANTFICGGAVNNGGNVVRWLLQQFLARPSQTQEDYAMLFNLVAQAPAGCEGLFCLPYLHGERTPLWDEQTCGVFFGFRPQHRQSHFIRAAVEGVCFGLYAVLKKLEEQTGPVHTLQVSGGVVHSDTWMQVLADVTGKTLCLVQSGDASAIGAALFYLKVASLRSDYLPAAGEAEQVFKPHAGNHVIYQKAFPVFSGLYQTVKATMHHHYQAAH